MIFRRVLVRDEAGNAVPMERTVRGQRIGHMVALSLPALMTYGLHAVVPTNAPDDQQKEDRGV